MTLRILETLERRRLLASPQVDLTFGEGGIAPVTNFWGDLNVMKELPDGKILVAGGANSHTSIAGFAERDTIHTQAVQDLIDADELLDQISGT